MICKNCGVDNKEHALFCSGCGQKLKNICPNCNYENEEGSKFCIKCLKKLRPKMLIVLLILIMF